MSSPMRCAWNSWEVKSSKVTLYITATLQLAYGNNRGRGPNGPEDGKRPACCSSTLLRRTAREQLSQLTPVVQDDELILNRHVAASSLRMARSRCPHDFRIRATSS